MKLNNIISTGNAKSAKDAAYATEVKEIAPYINNSVYENLPDILKEATGVFEVERERDVFLTGAIGVLSGCISNVSGLYDGRTIYPNLYTYINAPAASGKGVLAYTKYLGIGYHNYIQSLDNSESKSKAILFIPGNISASAFMGHLQSTGRGIFFETEADTIANTFKQEWGSFSDLLRKGYHHEPFSSSRKMDNEFIEIPSPRLSLVLSGTPAQVHGIINSAEDGLFSRVTFYSFSAGDSDWKDVSPLGNKVDLSKHFTMIGDKLLSVFKRLHSGKDINFEWSSGQWEIFNAEQTNFQNIVLTKYGNGAVSLVRRSGLMWFRIAMILSVLRLNNKNSEESLITCKDDDFLIAFEMMETYKEHNLQMFKSLPTSTVKRDQNFKEVEFLKHLPENFDKKLAVRIGGNLNISERTVANRLKTCLDVELLTSHKSGQYSKR